MAVVRFAWVLISVLLIGVGCAAPPAPAAVVPTSPAEAPKASVTAAPVVTAPTPSRAPIQVAPPGAAASTPSDQKVVPTALPTVTSSLRFDGGRAYQHGLDQCAIGPRPPGSEAIEKTRDYIKRHLQLNGWTIETQPFTYQGVRIENIVGKRGQGPVTIVGAHYDTRPVADKDQDPNRVRAPIIGGNDGASGVAVLLELARVLADVPLTTETWLTFFDAEDSGQLNGWPWSVGAEHMAANLTVRPRQVIVVDMIGDIDQQIYYETTSTQWLQERVFEIAHELGYGRWFIRTPRWSILDDHTPFLQRGIPAIDLIDFDYPYHHTFADDCTKIGPASLERVGRVVELFLRRGGN